MSLDMWKNCKVCKKQFVRDKTRAVYCSPTCRAKFKSLAGSKSKKLLTSTRKQNGLCVVCGAPASPYALCPSCRDKKKARNMKAIKLRIANNLCADGNHENDNQGSQICKSCTRRHVLYVNKLRGFKQVYLNTKCSPVRADVILSEFRVMNPFLPKDAEADEFIKSHPDLFHENYERALDHAISLYAFDRIETMDALIANESDPTWDVNHVNLADAVIAKVDFERESKHEVEAS